MNYVDLVNIPIKNKEDKEIIYDWENSIGKIINFEYQGMMNKFLIIQYKPKSNQVYMVCKNIKLKPITIDKLVKCDLYNVLKDIEDVSKPAKNSFPKRQIINNDHMIGKTNLNIQNDEMTVFATVDSSHIMVRFKSNNFETKCSIKAFNSGNVKNIWLPSVYGVGIIGDEYVGDGNGKGNKCYQTWAGIIMRCYYADYKNRFNTYNESTMHDDWIYYSNFKKWFDDNYYEVEDKCDKMDLDKDILIKGNKHYSPDTCIFVPHSINNIFTKRNANRGLLPIGVSIDKNKTNKKYVAQCRSITKGVRGLGYFYTPDEAFLAYKQAKEKYIKEIADVHKHQIPEKLYNALYRYEVEITD